MQRIREREKVVRFRGFELDLGSGILRQNDQRIPLQEQPFLVLKMLLERPGELITREDLHRRLWGHDAFVEFEDSLNHAVRKVREALGDSATSPRFVETLHRRGYRLVAPVEEVVLRKLEDPDRYWVLPCFWLAQWEPSGGSPPSPPRRFL